MKPRGDCIREVHPLFQEEGGGSIPTSPLQLTVGWVAMDTAMKLNALWHSRVPAFTSPPGRCRAMAAEHGGRYYASAIWSPPVARMLNYTGRYELRRLAIAEDAPPNTASRMLRIMRMLIARDMPAIQMLMSYQDTGVHAGTIYRAAGWTPVRTDRGGEWIRDGRTSIEAQAATPKVRWEIAARQGASAMPRPAAEEQPQQLEMNAMTTEPRQHVA
jgi:hypothetical protein